MACRFSICEIHIILSFILVVSLCLFLLLFEPKKYQLSISKMYIFISNLFNTFVLHFVPLCNYTTFSCRMINERTFTVVLISV